MSPNRITEMAWKEASKHYPIECSICKSKKKLLVHHKNKNRLDNRKENIKILCKPHHTSIHNKRGDTGLKGRSHSKYSKNKIGKEVKKFYKYHPEKWIKTKEHKKKLSSFRESKTYEELYGKEEAKRIKAKIGEKSKKLTKEQWKNPEIRKRMIEGMKNNWKVRKCEGD